MESAFNKLASLLPKEATLGRLDALRALFIPSPKSVKELTGAGPIIEDLTFAVLRGVTCKVSYHSFSDDTTKSFPINPLHFFERSGGLYLLVGRTGQKEIRTLAVERIRGVSLTSEAFKYPEGFDVDEYLDAVLDVVDGEPVQVAIRFSADQARYIRERRWSQRQSITQLSDGSIILRMTVLGLWDVTRWVLSHGPSAQVVSPTVLRRRVEEEARGIVSLYKR
jgi:predicted DNA-binding transcriptional regulator YafY